MSTNEQIDSLLRMIEAAKRGGLSERSKLVRKYRLQLDALYERNTRRFDAEG